jgi:hypothetical protein
MLSSRMGRAAGHASARVGGTPLGARSEKRKRIGRIFRIARIDPQRQKGSILAILKILPILSRMPSNVGAARSDNAGQRGDTNRRTVPILSTTPTGESSCSPMKVGWMPRYLGILFAVGPPSR